MKQKKNLSDVLGHVEEPDFLTLLDDCLDRMPRTRESVDKMLDALSRFDLWPVYRRLLTDCYELLTPEEQYTVYNGYKKRFDVSFPEERHLLHIPYCPKCRDVILGNICSRCSSPAVYAKGTVDEFKEVLKALADSRSEWREMLERMIRN